MIKLSEKHGLNPTIMKCFYCGGDAGIMLTGKDGEKMAEKLGRKDGQMPMHVGIVNDEPCSECAEYMKQGIIIIGTKDGHDPNEVGPLECRSGHFAVVREEPIRRLLEKDQEMLESVLKDRFMFMEERSMRALGIISDKESEDE